MSLKKTAALLLALLMLIPVWAGVPAEEDPSQVTYINLDTQRLNYNKAKAVLAGYPNLRQADMYRIPLSASQAEELSSLFPEVEFGWTLRIGNDHLVRTDATAFSTLHRSGSVPHSTRELSVLRYCKKLKALDFGHNSVDDISWLAELPELRVLIIAINKISDISVLSQLTKLEYLEIFNNRITDISPLQGLTHLMDLNLGYNSIADFSPLYDLPALRRLWAGRATDRKDNGIAAEAVQALREKLPDCQIDDRSMPSLGGWREHPHYDVIHEMFAGSTYIPFSDSFPDTDGADNGK